MAINKINVFGTVYDIGSDSGSGLTGYSGTIKLTDIGSYNNVYYVVIHSDGTCEKITTVNATNNVSNAICILIYAGATNFAMASLRTTNAAFITGDYQGYSFYQITGDNWTIELYEDI